MEKDNEKTLYRLINASQVLAKKDERYSLCYRARWADGTFGIDMQGDLRPWEIDNRIVRELLSRIIPNRTGRLPAIERKGKNE